MIETVKITESGTTCRFKTKTKRRSKNRKARMFRKQTKNDFYGATGESVMRDMQDSGRILGKPDDNQVNFRATSWGSGVNPEYDKRCHPYIDPKNR